MFNILLSATTESANVTQGMTWPEATVAVVAIAGVVIFLCYMVSKA